MSCAWFFSYELNIILEIQVETTNHFTRSAPNGLLLGINHLLMTDTRQMQNLYLQ